MAADSSASTGTVDHPILLSRPRSSLPASSALGVLDRGSSTRRRERVRVRRRVFSRAPSRRHAPSSTTSWTRATRFTPRSRCSSICANVFASGKFDAKRKIAQRKIQLRTRSQDDAACTVLTRSEHTAAPRSLRRERHFCAHKAGHEENSIEQQMRHRAFDHCYTRTGRL